MKFSTLLPRPPWLTLAWSALIVLALGLILRADLAHLRWVAELSAQGSPPPAHDTDSNTGYALGQRHFLGKHDRGETYRWIAATQERVATGAFSARTYEGDTVPAGRPQLQPRLYTWWLATVAWTIHATTATPLPLAVERAALWEPLLAHALACIAAVVFMARRYGLASAAAVALCFALLPSLAGQFLPGALTARTWAMLLAAYAAALHLPGRDPAGKPLGFSTRAAVAASVALWLDPAWGFPVVLLVAAAGAAQIVARDPAPAMLRWSLIGSTLTLVAWLIDRAPWAPAAGELRYVHPLYALAWLGLGLGLDALHRFRRASSGRKRAVAGLVGGGLLLATLAYVQVRQDFTGWFYPSVWMRRMTSLDEIRAFDTLLGWVGHASAAEVALLAAPALAALAALAFRFSNRHAVERTAAPSLLPAAVVFAGLLVLGFCRIRWSVAASLVALPLLAVVLRDPGLYRRIVTALAGTFFVALLLWNQNLPAALRRPAAATEPSPADVEALLYRHFAHWLATHTPGEEVSALAPPELSDSIVFHGGGRVLMSTAWESYPGQLAARRILSSLESTEAEAVVQGHGLTHLILPSWDQVLPLFVQAPMEQGRDTLFDRLRRWKYPAYLRPIPYRLPSNPLYASQTLAVFKVTPPQDEPLLLGRLAEYFVEMERPEPAALVARVLAEAYPDDPNAAMARAMVYAEAKQTSDFERELTRLVADATAGRAPFSWDRRVQRAIVLALGRKRELARSEIEACLTTATAADLLELTPLQAYRLRTLARAYRFEFPDAQLGPVLAALGAEYQREN